MMENPLNNQQLNGNYYLHQMSWGDLDIDGDIDLALVVIDDKEMVFIFVFKGR